LGPKPPDGGPGLGDSTAVAFPPGLRAVVFGLLPARPGLSSPCGFGPAFGFPAFAGRPRRRACFALYSAQEQWIRQHPRPPYQT
jgi:hypothetical protein